MNLANLHADTASVGGLKSIADELCGVNHAKWRPKPTGSTPNLLTDVARLVWDLFKSTDEHMTVAEIRDRITIDAKTRNEKKRIYNAIYSLMNAGWVERIESNERGSTYRRAYR